MKIVRQETAHTAIAFRQADTSPSPATAIFAADKQSGSRMSGKIQNARPRQDIATTGSTMSTVSKLPICSADVPPTESAGYGSRQKNPSAPDAKATVPLLLPPAAASALAGRSCERWRDSKRRVCFSGAITGGLLPSLVVRQRI